MLSEFEYAFNRPTSGDSSVKMTAPLVLTWMFFATGSMPGNSSEDNGGQWK